METQVVKHPPWLVQRVSAGKNFDKVKNLVNHLGIHTVCQSAACPNIGECFSGATATFLILGGVCTRQCRFCTVTKGEPLPLDQEEPDKVVQAVVELGLRHVVITSVTRDDLLDGGASQFISCISKIRDLQRGITVEVLVPDFQGNKDALWNVLRAQPDVFNHNIETVPRLYEQVRPKADYQRSLKVLFTATIAGIEAVKSGIMVGLGETEAEVLAVFSDLRLVGVTNLTVGQYLRPSAQHLPIVEYISPEKFIWYEKQALAMGFKKVAAGPLVRSSYHAADYNKKI